MLIGGPALVERALGVRMTKDELGGAAVHARSGIVDNLAEDEHDAFRQMRAFLSYLPGSVWERTPRYSSDDPIDRMEQDLLTAVPRDGNQAFDMRAIVEMVVDRDSFFEMGRALRSQPDCRAGAARRSARGGASRMTARTMPGP